MNRLWRVRSLECRGSRWNATDSLFDDLRRAPRKSLGYNVVNPEPAATASVQTRKLEEFRPATESVGVLAPKREAISRALEPSCPRESVILHLQDVDCAVAVGGGKVATGGTERDLPDFSSGVAEPDEFTTLRTGACVPQAEGAVALRVAAPGRHRPAIAAESCGNAVTCVPMGQQAQSAGGHIPKR